MLHSESGVFYYVSPVISNNRFFFFLLKTHIPSLMKIRSICGTGQENCNLFMVFPTLHFHKFTFLIGRSFFEVNHLKNLQPSHICKFLLKQDFFFSNSFEPSFLNYDSFLGRERIIILSGNNLHNPALLYICTSKVSKNS